MYLHAELGVKVITAYRVTSTAGQDLGTFLQGELAQVRTLVQANPGAQVTPVVITDTVCDLHGAYEATNCPICGTARRIGA